MQKLTITFSALSKRAKLSHYLSWLKVGPRMRGMICCGTVRNGPRRPSRRDWHACRRLSARPTTWSDMWRVASGRSTKVMRGCEEAGKAGAPYSAVLATMHKVWRLKNTAKKARSLSAPYSSPRSTIEATHDFGVTLDDLVDGSSYVIWVMFYVGSAESQHVG